MKQTKFSATLTTLLYQLLQCTWGILQTLIGFALFIGNINRKHYFYKGCIVTIWKRTYSGISLGLFIFIGDEPEKNLVRTHEYGHTIQSLILGPFYLIAGLVSILWAGLPYFEKLRAKKNLPYTACIVESNASRLGELFTGEKAVW